MPRPAKPERKADSLSPRDRILEAAARLICEKGYDATSIQDIADATGLTKAGLYHHIRSKESLLLEIQHSGMDVFEEKVLSELVTEGWSKEVTIILHEHATLTGEARSQINARKKRYVRFLETSFAEAVRAGRIRPVNPKVAAFSFLGMVLWIYKWFRPDGPVSAEQLAREMQDILFGGLEVAPRPPARKPRRA